MYRIVADVACEVGEAPLWHPGMQALYWVDIPRGRLFRYTPSSDSYEQLYQGRPIGGMTLQADGTLLCFRDKGNIVVLDPDGCEKGTVIDHIPTLADTRFNDVIAAPDGSVFAGTMSCDNLAGRLYHLLPDGTLEIVLENQGTPNGMDFSVDRDRLYYQDSRAALLWCFDYDVTTGRATNPQVLRAAAEHGDPGRGDGLTVDGAGQVWSARWEGSCILRCDAEGRPLEKIDFPAHCITSLTFGGDDYTDIYVTSARGAERATQGPAAGALFHLNTGQQGREVFRSAIALVN